MTKNLFALLLALQKATLDADQRLLLTTLGNKLEAIFASARYPNDADKQNVQAKINQLLSLNSTLAEQYQQILVQLQTQTDENLWTLLLPLQREIDLLRPQLPTTLGQPPTKDGNITPPPSGVGGNIFKLETETVVYISRNEDSKASKTLFAKLNEILSKINEKKL